MLFRLSCLVAKIYFYISYFNTCIPVYNSLFVPDKAKMDSEYMSLMAELGVAEEGAGLSSNNAIGNNTGNNIGNNIGNSVGNNIGNSLPPPRKFIVHKSCNSY